MNLPLESRIFQWRKEHVRMVRLTRKIMERERKRVVVWKERGREDLKLVWDQWLEKFVHLD